MSRWGPAVVGVVGIALLGLGCGSESGSSPGEAGGGTSGGGTGGVSGAAGSGGGGPSGGGAPGGTSSGGTSNGGTSSGGTGGGVSLGGTGGIGGCALSNALAKAIPFDAYVLLDQSSAMAQSAGTGTKWSAVSSALVSLLNSPVAQGTSVGLQYFPLPSSCPVSCGTNADCGTCGPCFTNICFGAGMGSCVAADYASPDVAISPLPGNVGALTSSIMGHSASKSGEPISATLTGGIEHAKAFAASHPTDTVAVILIVGSDPTSCDTSTGSLFSIAYDGANTSPRVLTHVIALGGTAATFDVIAAAGGTEKAAIATPSANLENVLQQHLDSLWLQAGCSYSLPTPPSGQVFDPQKVNLTYSPTVGTFEAVPGVAGKAACTGLGGWFYDNSSTPAKIVLCPSTCSLTADPAAKMEIVYGCATIVQ